MWKTFIRFFRTMFASNHNRAKTPEPSPQAPLLLLPEELRLMILSHLDYNDTACLALTCKTLQNAYLKPRRHPKDLPTYEKLRCGCSPDCFTMTDREERFWKLWYIYSSQWNLLLRLARDAPKLYKPCCDCLRLHWIGSHGRAPDRQRETPGQPSKPQLPCYGRSRIQSLITYKAIIAVIKDTNDTLRLQSAASQMVFIYGKPWPDVYDRSRTRPGGTRRTKREQHDFQDLLEYVWEHTPYEADKRWECWWTKFKSWRWGLPWGFP